VTVLAIDPGAKRLGWATLRQDSSGVRCLESGILVCERLPDEPYQHYRLRAMDNAISWVDSVFLYRAPDVVVAETIPVKGFNDMGQAYLALSVISAVFGYAMTHGIKVEQIGATTVKARIGGSNKATKVRVRNGVWQLIPDLQMKAKEWKGVYDESDAVAVGLAYLGYSRP
jgi:Holliday junction resolvasome RuvABC endonuclease subunit